MGVSGKVPGRVVTKFSHALLESIQQQLDTSDQMAEMIYAYLVYNEDFDEVDEFLYDRFESEMPYGTRKARTGDPKDWIANHMCHLFREQLKAL